MSHSRFVVLSASIALFFLLFTLASTVTVDAALNQQQTATPFIPTGMVAIPLPVSLQANWSNCRPPVGYNISLPVWQYSRLLGYMGTIVPSSVPSPDVYVVPAIVLDVTEHILPQPTPEATLTALPTLPTAKPPVTIKSAVVVHVGPFPQNGKFLATINPTATRTLVTPGSAVPTATERPLLPLDTVTVAVMPTDAAILRTAITHGWQVAGCQVYGGIVAFLPLDTGVKP